MRDYLEKACEEIDAALCTGDACREPAERLELQAYLDRWTHHLSELAIRQVCVAADGDNTVVEIPGGELVIDCTNEGELQLRVWSSDKFGTPVGILTVEMEE